MGLWRPSYKHLISLLCCLSLFCCYSLWEFFPSSLQFLCKQIAQDSHDSYCGPRYEQENRTTGEFRWSENEQLYVTQGFAYGILVGQIPSGLIIVKCGSQKTAGIALFLSATLATLTKLVAQINVDALFTLRVVNGLICSPIPVASIALAAYWSSREDNTLLVAIALSGSHLGKILVPIIDGGLGDEHYSDRLPLVFGFWSFLSFMFVLCWFRFAFDSPESRDEGETGLPPPPSIQEESKNSSLGLLCSRGVMGSIVALYIGNLCHGLVMTATSDYFINILGRDVNMDGFEGSILHLIAIFSGILSAIVCDRVRRSNISETVGTRKALLFFGVTIGSAFLLALRFVSCKETAIIFFLGMSAFAYSSISVQAISNVVDISNFINPNSVAFFIGWVNLFAVSGICSSALIYDVLIPDDKYQEKSWQNSFDLIAYAYFIAMFCYILLVEDEKKNPDW